MKSAKTVFVRKRLHLAQKIRTVVPTRPVRVALACPSQQAAKPMLIVPLARPVRIHLTGHVCPKPVAKMIATVQTAMFASTTPVHRPLLDARRMPTARTAKFVASHPTLRLGHVVRLHKHNVWSTHNAKAESFASSVFVPSLVRLMPTVVASSSVFLDIA